MSDTTETPPMPRPAGPDYRDTAQIPRVVVPGNTLDAVLSEVRAMREEQRASTAELTDKVDTLSINVDALQHDAKDTRLRLGRMERELDEVKDRQANASMRVRGESEANVQQDAAIGRILVDVEGLKDTQATQLAILKRLDAVAANPMVRRVAYGLGGAVLAYLASKGWLVK